MKICVCRCSLVPDQSVSDIKSKDVHERRNRSAEDPRDKMCPEMRTDLQPSLFFSSSEKKQCMIPMDQCLKDPEETEYEE